MAKTIKKKTPAKSISDSSDNRPDPVTKWANDVANGRVVAGPHIRNACKRHLRDIESGPERGLFWDLDAALKAINFFPDVLRLNGGQFEGKPFNLHPSQAFKTGSLFGWKRTDGTRRFRRAYIEEGKGNGKALALDTKIPTPTGWTTIADIQPGNYVLDENGKPNLVLCISPVMTDRDCYEVEFDDGEKIIADAGHLWATEKRTNAAGVKGTPKGTTKSEYGLWRFGVRTTREIADTLTFKNGKYQSANHSIQLSRALELPEASLPVDPYLLGAWLGDGDSDCARITSADTDYELIENLRSVGCAVGARQGKNETTGRYHLGVGIHGALRSLGVLNAKHIPTVYLRASLSQRLALLQGLMDTDGYINPQTGQCEFTGTNETLVRATRELIHTLGIKTGCHEGNATINGRFISRKWRVTFNPPHNMKVFRLTRKSNNQIERHNRRRLSADRRIVSCNLVQSVPVKCITVAAPSSLFLAGLSMVPTHNSPWAAGTGMYCLLADNEPRAEVYAAGKDKDQAMVLFRDAVAMCDQSPAIAARLTKSGGPGKEWNLADLKTASFFRPVTGEVSSGQRPYAVLADEIHEHPSRAVIEMLERGFKFRRQPLMIMITNSGSDRNTVCYEEHTYAVKVAAGTRAPDDDSTFVYDADVVGEFDDSFSFVCSLDRDDDPMKDPTCWPKANPLLGVTITNGYLAGVVKQAKSIPGRMNGILRLHFCVWTDSDESWMSRAALEDILADFDPLVEHAGKDICVGIDLSAAQDLTAMGFVVETGVNENGRPTYDAWVEAWTPQDTIEERSLRDKAPYDVWDNQGWLHAIPGKAIRLDFIAAHLASIQSEYVVKVLAYDRYGYRKLTEELDAIGLEFNEVEHPQGGRKRARPTETQLEAAKDNDSEAPLGLWMPGSIKEFESLIFEKRIRIQRNPVIISAIMSAALERDPLFDNYWFSKRKATNRIDPCVALAMAIGAATMIDAKPTGSYLSTDELLILG